VLWLDVSAPRGKGWFVVIDGKKIAAHGAKKRGRKTKTAAAAI
jgi:hypothetical protein